MLSNATNSKTKWDISDIPVLTGKYALITGANSGIGYCTAKALAKKGCNVILACRSLRKSEEAKSKLQNLIPDSKLIPLELDLSDFKNVSNKSNEILNDFEHIDLLINNAGIMHPPKTLNAQGYEIQFAVNHLAHMLLTLKLLPIIENSDDSRVVTITSGAQFFGKVGWSNLKAENYNKWESYANSKLANIMFAVELHNRIDTQKTSSLAAHPGIAKTNLFTAQKPKPNFLESISLDIFSPLFQSAEMGSLPQLFAATSPSAKSGEHYGPKYNFRGNPKLSPTARAATNSNERKKLWNLSEEIIHNFI